MNLLNLENYTFSAIYTFYVHYSLDYSFAGGEKPFAFSEEQLSIFETQSKNSDSHILNSASQL